MKIVIINGKAGSGKDTFVSCCQDIVGARCLNVSTVDFVKELATECGWDGQKTPKNRKFLSDLKDLLTAWGDVPYHKVEQAIELFKAHATFFVDEKSLVVFIHCREPQEIDKFVKRMNAISLFIHRPQCETDIASNHADAMVNQYQYDYTVINDGTIDDLRGNALAFLMNIGVDV